MKNYDMVKLDPVNNYVIFDKDELANLKKRFLETPKGQQRLQALQEFTQDMFAQELETVTSKKRIAPSGNPHDYISLATYWWPNPETKDGLPYIRKDGYANPEGEEFDKDKLRRVAYITYHSALLYYLTEDVKYYNLLEKHLIHWFANPETKMNPHMNYGQFVPGVVDGRREGIIDYTANFLYALRMLHCLRQLGLLQDDLYTPLKTWHVEFKQWLLTSEIGKGESQSANNHGTMYYLGLMVISEFIEDTSDVPSFIEASNEKMLLQVDENYTLPLETERTKSKNYTLMCYKGLLDTYRLSLGYTVTMDKSVLYNIANWMKPYYSEKQPWPYTQVTEYDKALNIYFAYVYARVFGDGVTYTMSEDQAINKIIYYLFA